MAGENLGAQARGMPGEELMEHAGAAVAATARALAIDTERWGHGPIVILVGPGNNGGDGLVAARRLAAIGAPVVVALVAAEARPSTRDARRNWGRILPDPGVTVRHTPVPPCVGMLGHRHRQAAIRLRAL